MSARTAIDCDGTCKNKKDVPESARIDVSIPGHGKTRLDFEIKCAGRLLQSLVDALPDAQRRAWLEEIIGPMPDLHPKPVQAIDPLTHSPVSKVESTSTTTPQTAAPVKPYTLESAPEHPILSGPGITIPQPTKV